MEGGGKGHLLPGPFCGNNGHFLPLHGVRINKKVSTPAVSKLYGVHSSVSLVEMFLGAQGYYAQRHHLGTAQFTGAHLHRLGCVWHPPQSWTVHSHAAIPGGHGHCGATVCVSTGLPREEMRVFVRNMAVFSAAEGQLNSLAFKHSCCSHPTSCVFFLQRA